MLVAGDLDIVAGRELEFVLIKDESTKQVLVHAFFLDAIHPQIFPEIRPPLPSTSSPGLIDASSKGAVATHRGAGRCHARLREVIRAIAVAEVGRAARGASGGNATVGHEVEDPPGPTTATAIFA